MDQEIRIVKIELTDVWSQALFESGQQMSDEDMLMRVKGFFSSLQKMGYTGTITKLKIKREEA